MPKLLIIDDHMPTSRQIYSSGTAAGYEVQLVDTLEDALEKLQSDQPEVAVLNLKVGPGDDEKSGFELLAEADLENVTEVLLVTDTPSYRSAARGMRLGASDYFNIPDEQDRLDDTLKKLGTQDWGDDDSPNADFVELVGQSPPMRRLYQLIRKVAPTEVTVMLAGESGSGKELAAHAIHNFSQRASAPYVAVNCGAVSGELIESELFGHEKGAFTGAEKRHAGFFERAAGGTLFLDEVTETDMALQVKLLRVLEVGKFRRVGGEQDLPADVRIIASTNRDPEEAVAEGVLREDLYYRLAQFPVRLPTLRERGDDVVLLAQHFLSLLNEEHGTAKALSTEVEDLLRLHDWPGNVRELKNAITRAYILASQLIEDDDLPGNIPSTAVPRGDYLRISVGHTLADVERRMILATLSHFEDDKKQAAKTLGISLKTLYNRLKQYEANQN